MKLPFKLHYLALICSAGLLTAAGTLYVYSREPAAPQAPAAAVNTTPTPAPMPTPAAPPMVAATSSSTPYTAAQITQWVAPIALYPDPLLSQVLMASTYPTSVVQAVQWSKDNPNLQGDAAVKAVAGQPWDASVKSLVAFPQLTAMMGEDPQWVENLGNAFLAQPQDVMDAVQKLRQLAQQTGSLKSTYQQTVTTTKRAAPASTDANVSSSAPTVIKIEPSDPQVVYVPNYNPTEVYGSSWPYTSAPPVYLPPPPGMQFADSFVRGFGYSLGVATTYAIFSNIDWDDDDHHHHDDDHHDDHHNGGYQHNGDNININVNNFNQITGQNLSGKTMNWQHNPAYRGNAPYPNNTVAQRVHQTDVAGGLSATAHPQPTRDSQRQAAMTQLQQRTRSGSLDGKPDAQRRAASSHSQRDNFRGYDAPAARSSAHTATHHAQPSHPQVAQRRNNGETPHLDTSRTAHNAMHHPLQNNALSGNESRAPSWQAQQSRGLQSRHASGAAVHPRSGAPVEHHEFRRR